jgi:hypothetical protein
LAVNNRREPEAVEGIDPFCGCPSLQRCKTERLACAALAAFAAGRITRAWRELSFEPSHETYRQIFGRDGTFATRKSWVRDCEDQ